MRDRQDRQDRQRAGIQLRESERAPRTSRTEPDGVKCRRGGLPRSCFTREYVHQSNRPDLSVVTGAQSCRAPDRGAGERVGVEAAGKSQLKGKIRSPLW